VFALIATNKNDTLECHAFLCPKKKMVRILAKLSAVSFQAYSTTKSVEIKGAV
jgi:low density lipoprotein receptor adapter protein 1